VFSDMGVAVTGKVNWFDKVVMGLMDLDDRFGGTHGYEFMNSGAGGTPIYLQRKGKSLGIIVDPTEGLVVFKHNGWRYKIDNKTPVTSTNYSKFLELLSDSKYVAVRLKNTADKVIKLVEDATKGNHTSLDHVDFIRWYEIEPGKWTSDTSKVEKIDPYWNDSINYEQMQLEQWKD